MVQGLIEHNKIECPAVLRGLDAEHNGESMKEWNPLLVAVALGKVEIVRYLLYDAKVSVKMAGRKPDTDEAAADLVESECFALRLAAGNKDLPMLTELWSSFLAYDVHHLCHMVSFMFENKWAPGLKAILDSYTTDVLFSGLKVNKQVELMATWADKVKEAPEM